MFGESESESPRVPSPWDSLISTPPSSSPSPGSRVVSVSSSPLANGVPRLVPENDDGNVEYKLQLLSPSPARFARLVTQLKWRLLEGGGQAYYELGVADSGALVGLPRAELEQSLETLEMMAGEIGASVIVVKEIEVPAAMADLAVTTDEHRRRKRQDPFLPTMVNGENSGSTMVTKTDELSSSTTTEDDDDGQERTSLSLTSTQDVFVMDPADVDADASMEEMPQPQFSTIDLEISTVYKPRPVRTRMHAHSPLRQLSNQVHRRREMKENKKQKVAGRFPIQKPQREDTVDLDLMQNEALARRQARDRRRAERRKALVALAAEGITGVGSVVVEPDVTVSHQNTLVATLKDEPKGELGDASGHEEVVPKSGADALVHALEGLHVSVNEPVLIEAEAGDEEEDVFSFFTPPIPHANFSASAGNGNITSTVADTNMDGAVLVAGEKTPNRLIVEALVVRKMSVDEGFLDFGGFALM